MVRRKKRQRTEDPLLCYMHQARNSDEHGIAPVTEQRGTSLAVGKPGEHVHIGRLEFRQSGQTIFVSGSATDSTGKDAPIRVRPRVILIQVEDERFGTKFDPPDSHLGNPMQDDSPLNVASLWLKYLAALIDEAAQFVR